jgi:dihydroorotase
MLPVLLRFVQEGRLSLQVLAEMTSSAPARLYNVESKGALRPGFDADIVLCDVGRARKLRRWDVQSKCGWSPFEESMIGEFPRAVYVRGERVAAAGKPVGQPAGRPATFRG